MEIRCLTESIKVDQRETGCEDGKWMELVHDHVHQWGLVLVALNFLWWQEMAGTSTGPWLMAGFGVSITDICIANEWGQFASLEINFCAVKYIWYLRSHLKHGIYLIMGHKIKYVLYRYFHENWRLWREYLIFAYIQ